MRKLFSALALTIGMLTQAHATTIDLSAKLTDIGQNYFGGGVVDYFHLGEVGNFSFTYDPTLPDPYVDPNGYRYVVSEFTLNTENYAATVHNFGGIKVTNTPTYDEF